jgi:manganese/zinc/iron transport system ATP- binding protein
MSAIVVEDLNVHYERDTVLWDISLNIPKGSLVGIIGPNGAGKSTLLKAILRIIPAFSGKVELLGLPSFQEARKKTAYVPQRNTVDWDFPMTAFELVLMGRFGHLGLFQRPKKADREAAFSALQRVGMQEFGCRQIGQLSGGQQQRLFIARALVQNADLFLLDEPFVGVDMATEKAMIALLKTQCEMGKTVCIIHHDLSTVEEYFDRLVLLNTRLVAEGPVKEVYTKENLMRTVGKNQTLFDEAANLNAQKLTGLV